jgi:hypothetical protein
MLAAAPDIPAPNGSTSVVQADVFLNRLDHMLDLGMGLPLVTFQQTDGVQMKIFFSKIAEDANLFIRTNKPKEFLEELQVKIVASL